MTLIKLEELLRYWSSFKHVAKNSTGQFGMKGNLDSIVFLMVKIGFLYSNRVEAKGFSGQMSTHFKQSLEVAFSIQFYSDKCGIIIVDSKMEIKNINT